MAKTSAPAPRINPPPPMRSMTTELLEGVPGLTREDILHWYLAALLLRVGTKARITFEELAQVKNAKIRHDVIDHAVELAVEVAP